MNNENGNHMPQEKYISVATKSLFLTLIYTHNFRINFQKKKIVENMQINQKMG